MTYRMTALIIAAVVCSILLTGCSESAIQPSSAIPEEATDSLTVMTPSAGTIDTYPAFKSDFVAARRISVWLPEQYHSLKAQNHRFAVLYMHDGQMLFDAKVTWNKQEWGVDEIAQNLIDTDELIPFIVVGIDNGGNDLRYVEYMPQKPFAMLPESIQSQIYARQEHSYKVQSDAYLRFIVKELKPFIDKHYATLVERNHTFVAGASMGGLISWYAVAEYPDVFGGCLCFSTHFPGGYDLQDFTVFNTFSTYMANHLPINGSHRLWFAYGDQTLDQYYPPFHEALQEQFTKWGADPERVSIQFFAGDDHSETSWQKQFPMALPQILASKPNDN